MAGRRFSDGLHQAIEAKEGVEIKDENRTLATITYPNFFKLYKKLSGMTGTAKTEEEEFRGIYNLDVITIPTNKPCVRIDEPDIIYRTQKGKIKAIVEEVKECREKGQPVLIGTVNINKSEEFSKALTKAGIKHVVLNAKNHEREGEIVAQAGRLGSVTIATNMAGRGTDILLGGNPEFMAIKKMENEKFEPEEISFATSFLSSDDEKLNHARDVYKKYYQEFKQITDEEKQKVIEAGGLHIIGTERHESRRIDNQLRGRSGRQGDVGSSIFFLSFEDDLILRFGESKTQKLADIFRVDDESPIQLRLASKLVATAQKKVESANYQSRKNVLKYDDVMNTQRRIIYAERNKVLSGEDVHATILEMIPKIIGRYVDLAIDADKPSQEWDLKALNNILEDKIILKGSNIVTREFVDDLDPEELKDKLSNLISERYDSRASEIAKFGADFSKFERDHLLRVVDELWTGHIDEMDILRNEIAIQQYGNHNAAELYSKEGQELFNLMSEKIQEHTLAYLLNANIKITIQSKENVQKFLQNNPQVANQINKAIREKNMEIARKNPELKCPCGSGKKFKDCCGKN